MTTQGTISFHNHGGKRKIILIVVNYIGDSGGENFRSGWNNADQVKLEGKTEV